MMNSKIVLFCIKSQISVILAGPAKSLKTLKMIVTTLLFLTFVNLFVLKRKLSTIQSLVFGRLVKTQEIVLALSIFSHCQIPDFGHKVKVTILKRFQIAQGIRMRLQHLKQLVLSLVSIVTSHMS